MALEDVPESIAWDDNLRITFTPEGADPLSVADLTAPTAKDLTYSLKSFNRTITEAIIDDERLTLRQVLQKRGKTSEGVDVTYVFGGADEVARPALAAGTKGNLTIRYSLPNETAWAVGQEVDVVKVECGRQRKEAPVANGVQTIAQNLLVIDVSQDDETTVA